VREAGDRLANLDLNTYPTLRGRVRVTAEPRRAMAEMLERVRRWGAADVGEADLLESPHVFVGTVDDLTDKLRGLRERFGVNSLMVGELDDRMTPLVEHLAGTWADDPASASIRVHSCRPRRLVPLRWSRWSHFMPRSGTSLHRQKRPLLNSRSPSMPSTRALVPLVPLKNRAFRKTCA
jgi:hypothetical protein